MALTKIKFLGFKDNKFSEKNGSFTAMINPESYKKNYKIDYSKVTNPGGTTEAPKYKQTGSDSLNVKIELDDTGAIPRTSENEGKTIDDMINEIKKVMYDYNSVTHEPNFVQVVWGSLLFNSRLESIDIDFKMFKPSGSPLRAEVTLGFIEYTDPDKEASEKNANSPDMTHIVTVRRGDNLPGLCYKIYKDSKYYLDVARVNSLVDIRNLEVGARLIFPPLK